MMIVAYCAICRRLNEHISPSWYTAHLSLVTPPLSPHGAALGPAQGSTFDGDREGEEEDEDSFGIQSSSAQSKYK